MDFIETLQKKTFYLKITGKEYEPLKFGDYFVLQELKDKFREAVRKRNKKDFRRLVLDIIELQTKEKIIPKTLADGLVAIGEIFQYNVLNVDAVMLKPPPKIEGQTKKEPEKDRWDYENRYVAQWIDIIARVYHWSLEQILNLNINTATYLIQEIKLNEQFEREWQWGLSEIAYQDKDGSGTRRYVPLNRPYWMNENIDGVIKTTKIRKDMLPSGVIIDLSGMGQHGSEYAQKSTEKVEEKK